MTIAALELLKRASKRGASKFRVSVGCQTDYLGDSPTKAWEAVKATEEAHVLFYNEQGKFLGVAFLMAPGPFSCDPDETIIDHSVGDLVAQIADEIFAEQGQ